MFGETFIGHVIMKALTADVGDNGALLIIDLAGLDATIFHNLEKFDLSGAQANGLVLDKDAVLRIGGTNGDAFSGDDKWSYALTISAGSVDDVNLNGTVPVTIW